MIVFAEAFFNLIYYFSCIGSSPVAHLSLDDGNGLANSRAVYSKGL